MAVLTGQGLLFAGGYDISGDIAALNGIKGGSAMLDTSTLDAVGMKRISGRFGGEFGVSVLYNPTGAHVSLDDLPTTAQGLMFAMPGTAAGDYVAMLMAKYVDYAPSIQNDLAAMFTLTAQASEGYPVEWGRMITAGKRTDSSATASGTGFALPTPPGVPTVAITSSTAASPTSVLTATAHGLQTGDSITITGSNRAALNADWTVTVTDSTHFTVPCDLSGGGSTGATMQRTSYRGWAAQNQVFSIAGTSVTVTIQDTEGASGTFANLTSGAFTAVTAGNVASERLTSTSGIIRKQVRVKTTGTFSSAVFATGIYVVPG
jgi:hypothetical protein